MILKFKQRFKNLKLKQKLIIFYGVLFILPLLLISIIIYKEVSEAMLEKIQYSALQGYEQSKGYLDFKILELIQRTDVIVTNNNLKSELKKENVMQYNMHEQLQKKEEIKSYLQSIESSTQGINIKLYIEEGFEYMKDGESIYYLSQADQSQWYIKKGANNIYFSPSIYLEEQSQSYIALVRDIPSKKNYRLRNSVLRMDIDLADIENIIANATPTENSVTYIVNSENIKIAVSNEEKFESLNLDKYDDKFGYSKYNFEGKLIENTVANTTVYFMRNKIKNTDWEMITIIPRDDMTRGITKIQYMVAGLMLFFGILTITGGTFIISWIVKRISILNESFNQVKEGDTEVYLKNDTKDEIGMLYDNYNDMMKYTNKLVNDKYNMGIELKSAELKALQSQINPHFLYNTLEMLSWLAYSDRKEEINTAVVSLSKYYRLILNGGEDSLTLGKELQHVAYYIKIQNIRFTEKITYVVEVDEKIKDYVVPKIILQPLVENAILHGICEKECKKGVVHILGYEKDNIVYIKVIDDGIGMDEKTLKNIMKEKNTTMGSGYGVKNVHARLQLLFGEKYGLSFESKEYVGTSVTICFPADAKKEVE